MAALWLAALPAQGAASLAVSPTRIWLGDSVVVTVGALGWYDPNTGNLTSNPSGEASGYWKFPIVTTDDGQTFSTYGSASTNVWEFGYFPSIAGTNTIMATNVTSVTVEVVQLTGISYSPNPVAVSSNVTLTVDLNPVGVTPPGNLEWSTNVTGSGTTAAQT